MYKKLSILVVLAWGANLALLLAAGLWVVCDGYSPSSTQQLWASLAKESTTDAGHSSATSHLAQWGFGAATVSMVGVLCGLVLGPKRCRSMRAWMLATALVSCWCSLFSFWATLHWEGQRLRVTRYLSQAESLVSSLQAEWPHEDGEIPQLGYFLAYPKHKPSTLMLLTNAELPETTLRVSAVEKTDDGAIAFELTGPEAGAWLEWRGDGLEPRSFVGGLNTHYRLTRWAPLGPHWRLVRYDMSPSAGPPATGIQRPPNLTERVGIQSQSPRSLR